MLTHAGKTDKVIEFIVQMLRDLPNPNGTYSVVVLNLHLRMPITSR